MNHIARRSLIVAMAATLGAATASIADAQEWPTKPIKIIVGTQPGGPMDLLSRIIAEGLTASLGQSVVVENKPGAGTTLAQATVASSAPDGYTLGVISNAPTTAAPLLQKLTYTMDSFTPIAMLTEVPQMFLVQPSLGVDSLNGLVELIKKEPGKYNYGSDGIGSSTHLGFELFKIRSGDLDVLHIPLKGTSDILAAYGTGDIHMSLSGVQAALGHVKDGRIKAIAVTGKNRLPALPDVPSIAESAQELADIGSLDLSAWFALAGPSGLPAEIRDRLNKEVVAYLNTPDIKAKIEGMGGLIVRTGTPDQLTETIAKSHAQWKEAIEKANIQAAQ